MEKANVVHKRLNSRRKGLEGRGQERMAAIVGEFIKTGENAAESVGAITLELLEDMRRMTICPAADSGWPAHANCKAEGDRIDWLVHGVYMERDDVETGGP